MPARRAPARSAAPPAQAQTLGFLLRAAYAELQASIYAAVAAAGHPGIREVHSPVLRHLPAEGGRVADIARASGLAKQSVTYVVEDLIELGYLRTEPDPEDARARRLRYTKRGLALVAALLDASRKAEARLAARIGPVAMRALRSALEALAAGTGATPRPA